MEKCKSCFVVASGKSAALELIGGASQFAEKVSLITLGERFFAEGVSDVYTLEDTSSSIVPYVGAIAKLIAGAAPELVLVELSRDGRLAAGVVAAALGTSVQTDVDSVAYEDGAFVTTRAGYGGLAVKTEKSGPQAVICAGSGLFAPAAEAECGEVKTISADSGVKFVERSEKVQQHTNLPSAKIVVCVGRGIGDAENLALAEELASVIGGEMGCTRPVAEEEKLMPSNRYIGVSGSTVKPQLYIGIGVSGQIQHTSGIGGSEYIVAINKDDKAAIFKECDLGVVGDAKDVVTRLTAMLRKAD
ncbi:MAG: electron transfer flavoprotein subunit alpha/FixB family protein [Candidatus Scatomorpha sp.]|jgi:electron transfer flavoprotein alpha subunit